MNETAKMYINPSHFLRCGQRVESCPAGAVDRPHP